MWGYLLSFCLGDTRNDTFFPYGQYLSYTSSHMRAMASSLVTLSVTCVLLVNTLALPQMRISGASVPDLAQRSTSPSANRITPILADLQLNLLNSNITAPTPSKLPINAWPVQCDQEAIPSGWVAAPKFHEIGDVIDCHRAIYSVTRGGGDPLEPQTWTTRADWSQPSCGVSLVPGSMFAHLNFARIEVAEIAFQILHECIRPQYGFMGGWVAIGGQYIVFLTGRGDQTRTV